MSNGLFKNIIYKLFYIYMCVCVCVFVCVCLCVFVYVCVDECVCLCVYKHGLALNNLQRLTYHKLNQQIIMTDIQPGLQKILEV